MRVARAAARACATRSCTEDGPIIAARLFTSELTLRFRAQGRSAALPGTLGWLAERGTIRFGSGASGAAHCRTADGLTLWASSFPFSLHLTHFLRTAYRADRLFTVNLTLCTFTRFAVHLAVRARAHGVALSRAHRVVTQPFALWVARSFIGHNSGSTKYEK